MECYIRHYEENYEDDYNEDYTIPDEEISKKINRLLDADMYDITRKHRGQEDWITFNIDDSRSENLREHGLIYSEQEIKLDSTTGYPSFEQIDTNWYYYEKYSYNEKRESK